MTRIPTHPGAILREDVIPELGISKTELARRIKLSRQTLNEILNERAPITPRTALFLGKVCGNGPKIWLNMQLAYDLAVAERKHAKELEAA